MLGLEQIGALWENIAIKIPRIPPELKLSPKVSTKIPRTLVEINPIDASRLRILSYFQNKECYTFGKIAKDLNIDYGELEEQLDILRANNLIGTKTVEVTSIRTYLRTYYHITEQGTLALEQPTKIGTSEEEWTWWVTLYRGCAADPSVQPALRNFATGLTLPLPIRKLVLLVLARYGTPLLEFLLPLYQWHPMPLRIAAIQALGYIRDPRAVDSLVEAMRDESVELRKMCAWALGEIRDPQALPSLILLLEDPNIKIQIEGIRALGKLQDQRASQPLLDKWETMKSQAREVYIRWIIFNPWRFVMWHRKVTAVFTALQELGINLSEDQLAEMYRYRQILYPVR